MEATLPIFDVQERKVGEAKPPSFPDPKSVSTSGFPAPKKRISAFKQRRQGQGQGQGQPEPAATSSNASKPTAKPGPGRNGKADPKEDAAAAERRRIDEENQAILASMSSQDIVGAQKDLYDSLDPSLIQMLLRRATLDQRPTGPDPFDIPPAPEPESKQGPPPEIKIDDTSKEPSKVDETPAPKPKKTVTFDAPPPSEDADPAHDTTHFPSTPSVPDLDPSDPNFLETLHKKYFPNLPADPSKLAWMAPIPSEHSAADRESPYYPGQDSLPISSLRFDFRGSLIPPRASRSIPVSKGLHHHGEAPEAAGYTILELARLARSAVPAQRCIAYQTLGRMLYRLGQGEWGVGAGGRDGDEDDLAFAMWRCIAEGRVLDALAEEASLPEGKGHMSAKAYATEALWLLEKGGWREKWRGL
ncbi:RPAP1-like protein [Podospora conica]|nr:RPAP1-like protein [Schizothecium conicum]